MSIRVDNRFIYKYLEEQHARDHARTIGEVANSKRKEIPFLTTLFVGAGLVILCIGFALYFANSYKKISENNSLYSESGNSNKEFSNQKTTGDDLIDIDNLLNKIDERDSEILNKDIKEIEDLANNDSIVNNQSTVRDYVIFDYVELDIDGIKRVVVGRQYDDPSSGMTSAWCYVENKDIQGITNTLYLININDQMERLEAELSDEVAKSFGTSLQTLKEARSKCTI